MSSSFRNRSSLRCHRLQVVVGAMCTANVMLAAPTLAAQFYVQPSGTLTAENDSNLDLDPGSNTYVQGYLATAGALFGVATPSCETTARARLEYRDYPKETADNRLEEYLDFRSDYSTPLSHAAMSGSIDHRDQFYAAFSSAYFDEINPVQPTNPTTGRAVIGETQTSVLLQPSYSYKFTPLIDGSVSFVYQKVSYSPTVFELSDFYYYQGNARIGLEIQSEIGVDVQWFRIEVSTPRGSVPPPPEAARPWAWTRTGRHCCRPKRASATSTPTSIRAAPRGENRCEYVGRQCERGV